MAPSRPLLFLFLASVFACSSSGESAPSGEPADAGASAPTDAAAPRTIAPPTFGKCPKYYATECAQLDVPLDHARPDGETIKLHIARFRATTAPAKRQLWLLSGGPGQAGESWSGMPKLLAPSLPDTDIYVVDHRGTGYSHRLTCSKQDTPGSQGGYYLAPHDVPSCLKELKANGDYDRLPFFTTAQAARDVALAIEATRAPGQKVFVWGASYGTHWAHRILQVAPDLADGIVFDGFVTPNRMSFVFDVDKSVDEAGKLFAAGCTADPSCSSRMGGDALAKTNAILDGLDRKRCLGGGKAKWRSAISWFMDGWSSRTFVFPLLHRLERCSPADEAAISKLVDAYNASGGDVRGIDTPSVTDEYRGSGVLQYNILLSELWNLTGKPDPSRAEIVAAAEAQTFFYGSSIAAELFDARTTWPVAPPDWKELPLPVKSRTRMLWLSGGLDTRTPPGQSKLVTELYDPRDFVFLPGAGHTPTLKSPLAADPSQNCGLTMLERFVGEERIDTSCIAAMRPVAYEIPTAELATTWWGDADDWGDGKPKPSGAEKMPSPAVPSPFVLGRR